MARATGDKPEYPLTLSDGVTTIGLRTPGNTTIRRLPRTVGVERKTERQDNWNGGRGNDRFSTDTSRFGDSLNLWTMVNQAAISGPLFNFGSGFGNSQSTLKPVGLWSWASVLIGRAVAFVPSASITINRLAIPYINTTASSGTVTVSICANNAGAPGTVLWTSSFTSGLSDRVLLSVFDPALAVTGGTTYWLKFSSATVSVQIGLDTGTAGLEDGGGGTWLASSSSPVYHIAGAGGDYKRVHFFEYKRALYAAPQRSDNAAAVVQINGDRGVATGTQTTGTLKDTSKTWTVNEWAGCAVYIYAGTNAGEYRSIASNTADTLTLSTNWPQACATGASGSEWVILGSDKWTPLVSGLAAACTSVAVLNNIVYMACGDGANIRRMREYNNAGTWTRDFADDGTNKATYLLTAANYSTSALAMYKANNDTSTVATAAKQNWGADLTFATGIECGGLESRINSIVFYDSAVHALKDDSVWKLSTGGTFGKVDISLETARDERNGVAAVSFNKNLYFSFMDGFQRLYGTVVDDIGPNRDEGMPATRRGYIANVRPVVQYLLCAYTALPSAYYSSILVTSSPGGDWHELFRAMETGAAIPSIFYQTVPGKANRLWMQYGGYLAYLVMPDDTHSPINDGAMRYAPLSNLITSWLDCGTPELSHFFQYLRVLVKGTSASYGVRVAYQTEADEVNWTDCGNVTTAGAVQQLTIGAGSVTGGKIRFRLTLNCNTVTPIQIKSFELRANQINEALYDVLVDLEFADWVMMMDGADSRVKAGTVITALETWKVSAIPLTVRCAVPELSGLLDNVRCNIDPFSLLTAEWASDRVVLQGNLQLKIV